jgi:hypothetical protein
MSDFLLKTFLYFLYNASRLVYELTFVKLFVCTMHELHVNSRREYDIHNDIKNDENWTQTSG